MAFKLFDKKERGMLSDKAVVESYAKYLQAHFTTVQNDNHAVIDADNKSALDFEEFKEYHVLNIIGRGKEFSDNLARDYQNTAVLSEKLVSSN